jgi:type 1 glutamine amidotransferase
MKAMRAVVVAVLCWSSTGTNLRAWDYEVHRAIVDLALGALPTNFPAFVFEPAARERVQFLSGEPDRWRNASGEVIFSHATAADHYLDLEDLEPLELRPENLPLFRYEFAARLLAARSAHPERFEAIDPARDRDRTRAFPGFLPWRIAEELGRLKSAFAYLRAYETWGGTASEVDQARQNVLYAMGILSHFVGDGSQPLHTTRHHHGWVGPNPQGYTTDRGIHAWIDGGYFERTGGVQVEALRNRLRPARILEVAATSEGLFRAITAWLVEQHQQVEPLYRLHKEGKFSGVGPVGQEGRLLLEEQLVRAAQMLADLWLTAWVQAPTDGYLQRKLQERQPRAGGPLRLLVVTGGHGFDRLPFHALFAGFTNMTFRIVEHPHAHAWFASDLTSQYDVVVLYDMWQQIGPEARSNFVQVTTSGKGVVALHHALAAYSHWDDYAELLGGRYLFQPMVREGRSYPASSYKHDVRFRIRVADPEHPVTRGVTDYEILDETYKDYWVAPDVKPLLLTDEPTSTPVVGWAKTNGLSRWVYLQGGHDRNAWEHPAYRRLVEQAIRWVAWQEIP